MCHSSRPTTKCITCKADFHEFCVPKHTPYPIPIPWQCPTCQIIPKIRYTQNHTKNTTNEIQQIKPRNNPTAKHIEIQNPKYHGKDTEQPYKYKQDTKRTLVWYDKSIPTFKQNRKSKQYERNAEAAVQNKNTIQMYKIDPRLHRDSTRKINEIPTTKKGPTIYPRLIETIDINTNRRNPWQRRYPITIPKNRTPNKEKKH